MTSAAIIIPFRDRGVDPLRAANLKCALAHWAKFGLPVHVVDDGRTGDAHFNRSAAYNRGTAAARADVLAYVESDTLLGYSQVSAAVTLAEQEDGVVIPFTHQHRLSEADSALVRAGKAPQECEPERVHHTQTTYINQGSANVMSRQTVEAAGRWDEMFEGHGHDDSAMFIAFERTSRRTRWIPGPAHHLYHLDFDPELTTGEHLQPEDVAAQHRNRQRLSYYRCARTPEDVRILTGGHTPQAAVSRWGATNWRTRWLAE